MKERRFLIPEEGKGDPTHMEVESQKPKAKSKIKKGIAIAGGLAAISAAEGQAQAADWRGIVGDAQRTAVDVYQTKRAAEIERARIEAQIRADMARIEAQRQRDLQDYNARQAQIGAEKEIQTGWQATEQQRTVVGAAQQGGWKKAKVKTQGGETTLGVDEGASSPGNMQEARLKHETDLKTLEQLHTELDEAIKAGDEKKINELALKLAKRNVDEKARADAASAELEKAKGNK